MTELIECR